MVETITFGHADRQRAHRRRGERGAARAAGGDEAAEVAPRAHEALEGQRHRGDGAAAVAAEHRRFAAAGGGAPPRAGARWPARACREVDEVDRDHAQAELLQALAQEEQLARPWCRRCRRRRRRGRCWRRPGSRSTWPAAAAAAAAAASAAARAGAARAMSAHRRGGAAGVPAVEAAHRARRQVVERRRAVAMRAAHGEHLRRRVGSAPAGARRVVGSGSSCAARAHAEQPLLQLAVGGQLGGRHLLRDAAVDHHADAVGHVDRHAEVLLDQQHRDLAVGGQRRAAPAPPARRSPAPGPRWARPSPAAAAAAAARGRSPASAARRRRAARRRCPCARPGAGTSRRCGRRRACFARHQAQRLVDRQRRPDAPALRHVGDAAPRDLVRRQAEDLLAEQPDAAGGRHQAGDGVAQRRLAHAVAADDAEHAAVDASGSRPAARGRGRSRRPGPRPPAPGRPACASSASRDHSAISVCPPCRSPAPAASFSISLGRAGLQHAAVVHHGDRLDHAQRDVEVVLDQHEAHVRRQRAQQRHQLAPLGRRQAGGRLVEQDQPRRAGQRHADLELALLAVRQVGHRSSAMCVRRARSSSSSVASVEACVARAAAAS